MRRESLEVVLLFSRLRRVAPATMERAWKSYLIQTALAQAKQEQVFWVFVCNMVFVNLYKGKVFV